MTYQGQENVHTHEWVQQKCEDWIVCAPHFSQQDAFHDTEKQPVTLFASRIVLIRSRAYIQSYLSFTFPSDFGGFIIDRTGRTSFI